MKLSVLPALPFSEALGNGVSEVEETAAADETVVVADAVTVGDGAAEDLPPLPLVRVPPEVSEDNSNKPLSLCKDKELDWKL